MNLFLLSMRLTAGLSRLSRDWILIRISKNAGPSTPTSSEIASLKSCSVETHFAYRYPHATAIEHIPILNPTVGCPPTDWCAPLFKTMCLRFLQFCCPIIPKAPICIRSAPSPSRHITCFDGAPREHPKAIEEACPIDP